MHHLTQNASEQGAFFLCVGTIYGCNKKNNSDYGDKLSNELL
jgi:hypothetical protein